jgi:hypothetical protein
VVIKITEEDQFITDLAETFTNLRVFQWKLRPSVSSVYPLDCSWASWLNTKALKPTL